MEYERKIRELLLWAKNKYELSMTFVTGDTLRDHDRQMIFLTLINKIESLLDADHRDASSAREEKPQEQRG